MITVREVTDEDIIPLAEFLPTGPHFKNTTKEMWLRRFEIWWNTNPAYTDRFPKGWVLENDSSIAGFIGNLPVKFLLCGEIKTAAAAVSWYVDPSVRGLYSLRLFNEYQKQNGASLLLFNSDDETLIPIITKNRYKAYFVPKFQKKYLSIIDRTKVGYIVKTFLFKGELPRFRELPGLMFRFWLLLSAYLHQKPIVRMSAPPEKEYHTSLCTSCDDSFFTIWEPYMHECDVTLSRDTKTLNWIYFSSIYPITRVVIQCRRSRDNSLAGYMVFDIIRKKMPDEIIMELMDICLEKHDPQVLTSLLAFATKIAQQQNAALLVLWADCKETEMFLQRNFTLKMDARQHNFIRLSDRCKGDLDSLTVCPSMIAPPRGIAHL
jgi:hypothetical protein